MSIGQNLKLHFSAMTKYAVKPLTTLLSVCVTASTYSLTFKEQHSSTLVEVVSRESQELRQ